MHDLTIPESARIRVYLEMAVQHKASDVHLSVDQPAVFRINGRLVSFDTPVLTEEELKNILYEVITPTQREAFEKNRELDFSHYYFKEYFFRANLHMNKGTVAATIRIMPGALRSLDELGLPPVIAELTRRKSGLVLLVGKAGSGKTTTMMHMVEVINQERDAKIITIEDPIEFVYQSKRSLIIQREVGMDTASFATGLKYALRQDPDVVVVGEMRDLESISMALTTAETGHLVIGTLHSSDAIEAVNRIIDVYPGDRQAQIRVQLAENLAAVVGQQLLPHKSEAGRVLATEVMVSTVAIRNMIRRSSQSEIRSQMETGREGMYTIEQCLTTLVKQGKISEETALTHAKFPKLMSF